MLTLGVRGRLLLAFLGIATFSLVAAASGLVSLSLVGNALTKVTDERVPQALSWLELSSQAERVVRAAPALLVVTTEEARDEVSTEIASQAEQLDKYLEKIRNYSPEKRNLEVERIAALVRRLNANLVSLDELVKQRIAISKDKENRVRQLTQVNGVAQRMVAPGKRILEGEIVEWNRQLESNESSQLSQKQDKLARSIIGLVPQQKVAVLFESAHNALLTVSEAKSASRIDVQLFPLKRFLTDLAELTESIPKRVKERFVKQLGLLEALVVGPTSLAQVRKSELAVIAEAEELLVVNENLSKFLTQKVGLLIQDANSDIADARSQAQAVQDLNTNVLVGVALLSLVSSILIVWLYVGRNLIARLTALSDSMLAIAGGNLRAALPAPGGEDEIGRMAAALVVFRDTAIEVEESNLRDIEAAQRRLVDAIENSSEGFAFYDPSDLLVICNTRYQDLLYPDAEIDIEPGMAFETIIRTAAEGGHIVDAEGRIDEWVAERLALHHNPGEARVQRRRGGQWIMVTERKTGDGGTVAIYSDITDLKQREEDLTTKSNALEQLSNQLAKYLSPQVYDSIFSGKQEVRLVSERKRLTVFFSDLVGFTSTVESLESEDLTQLLNHYLTEMSQIALEHGATIDKYIGDAIVIFFGDPETLGVKEDAIACVTMAIAMRKRMKELESVWMESGIENPLQCRMGINTGVCTVGNFGSEARMDYTIIGGGVNLAARLETACPANEILISYETHAHVKDLIECQEEGQIKVKGISHPVTTHRVIDLYENLGEGKQPIRTKMPHMRLDVDVNLMNANEKREAAAVLLETAERLSNIGAKP